MTSTSQTQTSKIRGVVTVAAAALLLTTHVVLAAPLNPASRVMIDDRVCAGDLGLDRSTADYHACISNLDHTLFQNRMMSGGYHDSGADNFAAR
jgi:hypothetical protein